MIVQGQEVVDWIVAGTGIKLTDAVQAIGLVKNGNLVAGTAYDCWTGRNIFAHQRIVGKTNREYWRAITSYPFNDLGCDRVTVMIDEHNRESINIVKHMGFEEEGRLVGAVQDGSDMVYLVLWKEDCKMLNWRAK
jgi:L-amino acid N-acyltransferase YncA